MQYPDSSLLPPLRTVRRDRLTRALILLGSLALTACSEPGLPTASGDRLDWDELRGQWVLVNYWAEWCKPCREEIPELNAVDRLSGVTVLGVNFDEVQGQALRDLGAAMGIQYTMLATDPGPGFGWQLPVALPATFVVDPDGELHEARFGPQTEAQLREMIGH